VEAVGQKRLKRALTLGKLGSERSRFCQARFFIELFGFLGGTDCLSSLAYGGSFCFSLTSQQSSLRFSTGTCSRSELTVVLRNQDADQSTRHIKWPLLTD
jgi:hypothetical protein